MPNSIIALYCISTHRWPLGLVFHFSDLFFVLSVLFLPKTWQVLSVSAPGERFNSRCSAKTKRKKIDFFSIPSEDIIKFLFSQSFRSFRVSHFREKTSLLIVILRYYQIMIHFNYQFNYYQITIYFNHLFHSWFHFPIPVLNRRSFVPNSIFFPHFSRAFSTRVVEPRGQTCQEKSSPSQNKISSEE